METIVWLRPDGGVTVTSVFQGTAVEEAVRLKANGTIPASFLAVDAQIPTDLHPPFFNALSVSGRNVVVDMVKARAIHRKNLQALAKPRLDAMNEQFAAAVDTGDVVRQGEISLTRRALRNVASDPAIDVAATPDELKTVLPLVLR